MTILSVNEERTIEVAATAITYFERTQIYQGVAEIQLGPELVQHLRQHAGLTFEALRLTTTVRNYVIENVVVDADTVLLSKDGRPISETVYFADKTEIIESGARCDPLVVLPTGEDAIVGYNKPHRGYQHWLTQCLPALDWSLRQNRDRPVRILLPELELWQEDFLRMLGYEGTPRCTLRPGTQYIASRAEYSEYLNGSTSFRICLSGLDTARRVLRAVPDVPSPHKILYVPCANPYYGSIENDEEIIAALERHDAYIVKPSELAARERINLFRHAELVIGPFGEGLTDILFCEPGTVLWEWMPHHHQNASINRLAQAAGVHYWGDLFETTIPVGKSGPWRVDADHLIRRLSEMMDRSAVQALGMNLAKDGGSALPMKSVTKSASISKPIDELLLSFESLGDDCDFGFVQRYAGVEPLGLLRFAAMVVPDHLRLKKLAAALECGFAGLASADTISVFLSGEADNRMFMARDSTYNLQYHTGVPEGQLTPDELQLREIKRLKFLRRKLIEELKSGEKIWVWKSWTTLDTDQIEPLVKALRFLGSNTLLWVVEADGIHPPGTVEMLDSHLMKGYVEHNQPYSTELQRDAHSWIRMCQNAYALWNTAEDSGDDRNGVTTSSAWPPSSVPLSDPPQPDIQIVQESPPV